MMAEDNGTQDDSGLLDAVKRKLHITWDDAVTNARIADAIGNARPALSRAIGLGPGTEAFDANGEERGLLLNCIFYEYMDAMDDFWVNYSEDVQSLLMRNRAAESCDGGADGASES